MSATSAMKCTPQNTMYSASVCAASRESLSESPVRSAWLIHVGALVVVAQNHGALAELRPSRRRCAPGTPRRRSGSKRSKAMSAASIVMPFPVMPARATGPTLQHVDRKTSREICCRAPRRHRARRQSAAAFRSIGVAVAPRTHALGRRRATAAIRTPGAPAVRASPSCSRGSRSPKTCSVLCVTPGA